MRRDCCVRKLLPIRNLLASFLSTKFREHSQLNHRDLLKKMAVKPDSHDFMLKTKFNREETLKVKSIYDSILAVALKNDQQATFRGINR